MTADLPRKTTMAGPQVSLVNRAEIADEPVSSAARLAGPAPELSAERIEDMCYDYKRLAEKCGSDASNTEITQWRDMALRALPAASGDKRDGTWPLTQERVEKIQDFASYASPILQAASVGGERVTEEPMIHGYVNQPHHSSGKRVVGVIIDEGAFKYLYEALDWLKVRLALRSLAPDDGREGFYEKLWKDFCSLQRGDAQGVCAKVEKYYREQAFPDDGVRVPREQLRHWLEYWNGNENERAMADALHHILDEIPAMLAAADKGGEDG